MQKFLTPSGSILVVGVREELMVVTKEVDFVMKDGCRPEGDKRPDDPYFGIVHCGVMRAVMLPKKDMKVFAESLLKLCNEP